MLASLAAQIATNQYSCLSPVVLSNGNGNSNNDSNEDDNENKGNSGGGSSGGSLVTVRRRRWRQRVGGGQLGGGSGSLARARR
jgi:hypothetical protein